MTRLLVPVTSVLLLLGALWFAVQHVAGGDAARLVLPACQYEDSPGPCVWDAQTQGNGRGDSFWRDALGAEHPL